MSKITEEDRLTVSEVNISPVEEKDLKSIAEGYYASFDSSWHDMMEPLEKRPASDDIRVERFAKRMMPWLTSPDGKWMKASLTSDPDKVIGHAGWLVPRDGRHVLHHWRRDATVALGWQERLGWTDEEVQEMWSHVNLEAWQMFVKLDEMREKLMKGRPHWFLAPIWVLPKHQGRGVSTLLLKDVLDLADAVDPPTPVFLEALPAARAVYEHFGFEGYEDFEMQMVRYGPASSTKKTVED